MNIQKFINKENIEVNYVSWEIDNPKASVVISHGMAEHPRRYDDYATFLNNNGYNVYAIYHIGHGEFAKKLGHMGKNEFDLCVSNINELVEKVSSIAPVFLLGHSMGSFMSQLYITRYNNLKGVILSGSTKSNVLFKAGSLVASLICAFSKDSSKPSPFLDKLSFGSYNNAFNNPKTKFDWLSNDEIKVQEYIDDPYCGYICSQYFFKNLTSGCAKMDNKKMLNKINKDLPIFILGGSKDPVSNNGKGLNDLNKQYQKLNIKDVNIKVYENGRHEMFNELNRQEVYADTLSFLNNHL